MEGQGKRIVSRFLTNVQGWQLRKIQEAITEGYLAAEMVFETLDLESPLERQAKGHLRGSIISQKLLGLNAPQDGLEIKLCENTLGSFSYAEVTLNDLVRLTVKTNDDPFTLPEDSDYRVSNAKVNPEHSLPLLELIEEKREDTNKELLDCILTHKPLMTGKPEFISVVFPCKRYQNVLANKDLLECCEELEAKEDKATIKRRRAPIEIEKKPLKLKKQG